MLIKGLDLAAWLRGNHQDWWNGWLYGRDGSNGVLVSQDIIKAHKIKLQLFEQLLLIFIQAKTNSISQ